MILCQHLVLLSMLIQVRRHSDPEKVEESGIRNMLDRKIVYEVYVHPPFMNGNYFSNPAIFRYSLKRGSERVLSSGLSILSQSVI